MVMDLQILYPLEAEAQRIHSVPQKKTQYFSVTNINLLMLFKERIRVYSENHTKPVRTNCRVVGC
jgi:hypothetical protein